MALPSRALKYWACGSRRLWTSPLAATSVGGPLTWRSTPHLQQNQSFSVASRSRNEARERVQIAAKEVDDQPLSESDTSSELDVAEELEQETKEAEAPHVPWYLQVESPVPVQENALSARQQIPELPEHPPALLEPLLKQVSVELGMDDLTLLDLREMDPPPALGANLFMLVGTARSERHLHVSADKLCRWLRTYYDLTPVADGLLGRQELKVKMRRRAKRARLMSAVGAKSTADTELEEGIRTGWVCVNVGRVEGGELPKSAAELEAETQIVGFGSRTKGSHLVVQLMTEEKRGELDLEKLWTGILRRSKNAKAELLKVEEEDVKVGADPSHQSPPPPQASSSASSASPYSAVLEADRTQQQSQYHPISG